MKTQKVWFITGASRGFGLEIARAALAAGDQIVATVRSQPTQLAATLHNHPDLYVVQMDVTQEDQVQAAVKQGIARFGRIDVLDTISKLPSGPSATLANTYCMKLKLTFFF